MKNFKKNTLFLLSTTALINSNLFAMQVATYEVTITSNINALDHAAAGQQLPQNLHFSPIVATAHNRGYEMFVVGKIASNGIEQVAETGVTTTLRQEIASAIDSGSISSVIETQNQFVLRQATQKFQITLSEEHPLLSFVSMIAPSPDWIIGLSNINMFRNGAFINGGTANLYAINANTAQALDTRGNFSLSINLADENNKPIENFSRQELGFSKPFANVSVRRLP